jgi:hypothetical protein
MEGDPMFSAPRIMAFDSTTKAIIAALYEEIDSIHFANRLFWGQKGHSREAHAEYESGQERLEQIRTELATLTADGLRCKLASCKRVADLEASQLDYRARTSTMTLIQPGWRKHVLHVRRVDAFSLGPHAPVYSTSAPHSRNSPMGARSGGI